MKNKLAKIKLKNESRRGFIQKGSLFVAAASILSVSGLAVSCKDQESEKNGNKEEEENGEKRVSANEDLMRELGLLQRMLLIYDRSMAQIKNNEDFNPYYINQTATIVRNFVEEYHEKLEENYLFPRLKKANTLTDLVDTLIAQHAGGRQVTNELIGLTKNGKSPSEDDKKRLLELMNVFNVMYRPHESREDTILFPAFKKVVSQNEYDSLGEDFERKEHEKFGGDGFDMMVDKVAGIEKQLGIYDLDQFTPHV